MANGPMKITGLPIDETIYESQYSVEDEAIKVILYLSFWMSLLNVTVLESNWYWWWCSFKQHSFQQLLSLVNLIVFVIWVMSLLGSNVAFKFLRVNWIYKYFLHCKLLNYIVCFVFLFVLGAFGIISFSKSSKEEEEEGRESSNRSEH